jgi:ribosomal protein S1
MRNVKTIGLLSVLVACSVMFSGAAPAAKSYQVTGKVTELTDAKIVVEKPDGDKWEIDRTADTKCDATIKVGDKVTVMYTMTAKTVTAKAEGAAEKKEEKSKK